MGLAADDMGVDGVEATERFVVGTNKLPLLDDIRDAMFIRARMFAASSFCRIVRALLPAARANLLAHVAVTREVGTTSLLRFLRRHGGGVSVKALAIIGPETGVAARFRVGQLLGEVKQVQRLQLIADAEILVGFERLHRAALQRLSTMTWLECSYMVRDGFTKPRHVWTADMLGQAGVETEAVEDAFATMLDIFASRLRRLRFRAPHGWHNGRSGAVSDFREGEAVRIPFMPRLEHLSHSGLEAHGQLVDILRAGVVTTFEGWPTAKLVDAVGPAVVERIDTLLVFSNDYQSGHYSHVETPYVFLLPFVNLVRLRVDQRQRCDTRSFIPRDHIDIGESVVEQLAGALRPGEVVLSKLEHVLLNSRIHGEYFSGAFHCGPSYADNLDESDGVDDLVAAGVRISRMQTIEYAHAWPGSDDGYRDDELEPDYYDDFYDREEADNDAKVAALNKLEVALESGEGEGAAIDEALLSALNRGLRNANHNVALSSLGCLALIPALHDATLETALTALLPTGGLIDRLGDARERTRELAFKATLALARSSSASASDALDRHLRDLGLSSKQSRCREASVRLLVAWRASDPLAGAAPLRPYLPLLVGLLEDSDGTVRDAAREGVVALFAIGSGASNAAREGLKAEMTKRGVRKTIADAILAQLAAPSRASEDGATDSARASVSRTTSLGSVTAAATGLDLGPAVDPVYITSAHDLERETAAMLPAFEGKESEANWQARETAIIRLRGMIRGEVADRFATPFVAALKQLVEGIIKAASSLRTTLVTAGCTVVGELASALGHALDPLVDPLLVGLLKLASQTKRIVVSASQASITSLLTHCSLTTRTLGHLHAASSDKNLSVRTAAAAHIRTILDVHAARLAALESQNGAELVEKAIGRGLIDAHTAVRETSRASFYAALPIWPVAYSRLREALDPSIRAQLDKANPATMSGPVAAAATNGGPSKPRKSIRDMVAAKRAATPTEASSSSVGTSTPRKSAIASPAPKPPASAPRARPASMYSPAVTSSPLAGPSRPRTATAATPVARSPPLSTAKRRPLSMVTPGRGSLDGVQRAPLVSGLASTDEHDLMSFSTPAPIAPRQPTASRSAHSSSQGMLDSDADDDDSLMVDDARRDQARQAEQAAELLLELAKEDTAVVDAPKPSGLVAAPVAVANGHHLAASSSVFADSPDPSLRPRPVVAASKRESWWLKQQALQPRATALPSDPTAMTRVLETILAHLEAGSASDNELRSLSRLAKDHAAASGGDGGVWQRNRLFARVYAGVAAQLRQAPTSDPALVLLADLVTHQTALLSGLEISLFDLLLDLRLDPSKHTLAATDAIAQLLCERVEPLYCLDSLRKSLEACLDRPSPPPAEASSRCLQLGLRGCAILFERLPGEVLEEELPRTRSIVLKGMSDRNADTRQAAVRALVVAQIVLQNEAQLFALVDGLTSTQQALLTYYNQRETSA